MNGRGCDPIRSSNLHDSRSCSNRRFTFAYPDSFTHIPNRGSPSIMDFFLTNITISKPKTIDALNSDYFPVLAEIDCCATIIPLINRNNFQQVDWQRFGQVADLYILTTDVQTRTDDDNAIRNLEYAIKTAENECVPTVITKTKFIKLDPETKNLITKRNDLRRRHQRSSDIILKQHAAMLGRIISYRVAEIRNKNFGDHLRKLDPRSNAFPPPHQSSDFLKGPRLP